MAAVAGRAAGIQAAVALLVVAAGAVGEVVQDTAADHTVEVVVLLRAQVDCSYP